MVNNENKILLELEEIGQKLAKARKDKELWQKRFNGLTGLIASMIITCLMAFFMLEDRTGFYIALAFAVFGLLLFPWAFNGLSNINQEIKKLERERKQLRNSAR